MRIARFSRVWIAVALFCAATPALAQSTYPTAAGGRVAGVVPLQCDTNGANCLPSGSSGAPATQVQGNVANNVADSGNPVEIGGRAAYSPVAVNDGTRVTANFTPYGSLMTSNSYSSVGVDAFSNASLGAQSSPGGTFVLPQTALYNFNGTTWDRQRGDVNGSVVQPALSSAFWSFAPAAGGILNTTTAVTVKTAAGVGVRNYIDAMQCNSEPLTTASELAIRDGAAGTVLWRGKIPTVGWVAGREMVFSPPIKGTANTLVEIVTLTASGAGAVYCNLQGYTGS